MNHPWWYILYNVTIWIGCLLFSYSKMKDVDYRGLVCEEKSDKNGIFLLFVLFFANSLFTFFGGDDARYEFFVTEGFLDTSKDFQGIDPLYAAIAGFTGGNFLLWKTIVYGSALIFTYIALKRLNNVNYTALFSFTLFCLSSYGSTRSVLAYAIFMLAMTYLASDRLLIKLIGILLAISTISAHSSMVLVVALVPLVFLKLNKSRIIILIALFPVMLVLFNHFYPYIFSNADFMGSQSGYKLGVYTENVDSVGTGSSLLLSAHIVIDYIAIILFILYSLKANNKGLLPKAVSYLIKCSFLVFYMAMLIRFSNMPGREFITTRYVTLIPFLLFATLPYLYNSTVITRRERTVLLSVSVFDFSLLTFMLTYYAFMGR